MIAVDLAARFPALGWSSVDAIGGGKHYTGRAPGVSVSWTPGSKFARVVLGGAASHDLFGIATVDDLAHHVARVVDEHVARVRRVYPVHVPKRDVLPDDLVCAVCDRPIDTCAADRRSCTP